MKQWLETRQVFAAIAGLRRRGRIPAALATVVRVHGSAYRHEGAKLVVGADGTIVGQRERWLPRAGRARGGPSRARAPVSPSGGSTAAAADEIAAWDLGVGCEGTVELYIAPVSDDHAAERAAIAREAPFVVELPLGSAGAGRVVRDGPGTTGLSTDGDGEEVFVDAFIPPPRLLVCGAGDDAIPLARLGVTTGFRVVVTDRRPGLLTAERFGDDVTLLLAHPPDVATTGAPADDTFAVVMTHHYADDSSYLTALRETAAPYIGMLGPRQRTERMLSSGLSLAQGLDGRIHAPAGLDIGTDGAEQVALSIIAEIMAVHAGRPARPLRERRVPIHSTDG